MHNMRAIAPQNMDCTDADVRDSILLLLKVPWHQHIFWGETNGFCFDNSASKYSHTFYLLTIIVTVILICLVGTKNKKNALVYNKSLFAI